MTEKYSNKIKNYTCGLFAATMLAGGCATSNHSTLDNKVNSANIPTTSAKKDVPYKAVVTPTGMFGVSVDFDSCKDLVKNTGKALGSLAYGATMLVHPYHNTADGKKIWAPGFRVIKYPEHSVARSFFLDSYKSGECAQTLGLDFAWGLGIYSLFNKNGGNEAALETKAQTVQPIPRTYEQPKEQPAQQNYVPPVIPPIPTGPQGGDISGGNVGRKAFNFKFSN